MPAVYTNRFAAVNQFRLSVDARIKYSAPMPRRIAVPCATLALLAALLLALPWGAAAHDIPNDVTVQAFVKPAGEQLHLLVRVPLKAISDIDFPERAGGYLDLARTDA